MADRVGSKPFIILPQNLIKNAYESADTLEEAQDLAEEIAGGNPLAGGAVVLSVVRVVRPDFQTRTRQTPLGNAIEAAISKSQEKTSLPREVKEPGPNTPTKTQSTDPNDVPST